MTDYEGNEVGVGDVVTIEMSVHSLTGDRDRPLRLVRTHRGEVPLVLDCHNDQVVKVVPPEPKPVSRPSTHDTRVR